MTCHKNMTLKGMKNKGRRIRHPSKIPYSLWDHSPFLKAFFKKSVKYFGAHMKDAPDNYQNFIPYFLN